MPATLPKGKKLVNPLVNRAANHRRNICAMEGTNKIRQKRLLEALAEFEGSQAELADIAGVAPSYLTRIKNGTKPLSNDSARKLERELGYPAFWFDKNDDGSLPVVSDFEIRQRTTSQKVHCIGISYLSFYMKSIRMGNISMPADIFEDRIYKPFEWFQQRKIMPHNMAAVIAKGDENADFICDGDLVFFNRHQDKPESGLIHLIEHPDGVKIVKLRQTLSGWSVETLNKDYPPELISHEIMAEINVIGRFISREG